MTVGVNGNDISIVLIKQAIRILELEELVVLLTQEKEALQALILKDSEDENVAGAG